MIKKKYSSSLRAQNRNRNVPTHKYSIAVGDKKYFTYATHSRYRIRIGTKKLNTFYGDAVNTVDGIQRVCVLYSVKWGELRHEFNLPSVYYVNI